MKKSGIALVATGGLIGLGIILSFYGNYIIFEDLSLTSGAVNMESNLILEADLDNSKSKTGIFAVQIIDFKDQTISVRVVDPFNNTIESKTISEESYEGIFNLETSGTYQLIVENNSREGLEVSAAIGPEPDEGKKSLSFVSLYILVTGLIGMAIVSVLSVINRKRNPS